MSITIYVYGYSILSKYGETVELLDGLIFNMRVAENLTQID